MPPVGMTKHAQIELIDTEGGAQQDRLDGGAQLLPLGLGERVRLGTPVRRVAAEILAG
jgi:hypothetical protein